MIIEAPTHDTYRKDYLEAMQRIRASQVRPVEENAVQPQKIEPKAAEQVSKSIKIELPVIELGTRDESKK